MIIYCPPFDIYIYPGTVNVCVAVTVTGMMIVKLTPRGTVTVPEIMDIVRGIMGERQLS